MRKGLWERIGIFQQSKNSAWYRYCPNAALRECYSSLSFKVVKPGDHDTQRIERFIQNSPLPPLLKVSKLVFWAQSATKNCITAAFLKDIHSCLTVSWTIFIRLHYSSRQVREESSCSPPPPPPTPPVPLSLPSRWPMSKQSWDCTVLHRELGKEESCQAGSSTDLLGARALFHHSVYIICLIF